MFGMPSRLTLAGSVVHLRRIFEWIDLELRSDCDAVLTRLSFRLSIGHVSVTNVSVDYKTGRPIISGLSFDFRPRKMTAIGVGRSGDFRTRLSR